ncbi:MAG: tRNA preQ1(34) S-adenosylmethionine ribosyltransferase-isomerase QueA [Acidobacteria bacterium]|nr:tRNA preQ1(34) S-adenosylmethionine ribosyltransferase-isomerase QueA [Acidobacteriota bacterium]
MRVADFDYYLPPELIAQQPSPRRDGARMLVLDRAAGLWHDRLFVDLPGYLAPGDCLVLNDSRVFPSRLLGTRRGSGKAEIFLVKPLDPDHRRWTALARPGRRLPVGAEVTVSERLAVRITGRAEQGERTVELVCEGRAMDALEEAGHVPLPPYIHRPDTEADRERYQTVVARHTGSVAAPTAGLHFTETALESCRAAGATVATVTLHVGLGTFQALKAERLEEIRLHSESFAIAPETAAALAAAHRIVAVGTTSTRTLETAAAQGAWRELAGDTNLFISPGYKFRAVQALLTNFHLPQSSLLMLVSAFAGRELTLAAYRYAVEQRYRFFSYGDCMLVL